MSCMHLDAHRNPGTDPQPQNTDGCQDCLAIGETDWVHLRLCLNCGHVGCCDSSPRKHASAHHRQTATTDDVHPVIRSFEPRERWRWCYLDEIVG
jgi:Zn ribbon nucleic-acid-binding protein